MPASTAKATVCELPFSQQKDRLRIEILDWGTGFDPKNVKEGSYGLTGIRKRQGSSAANTDSEVRRVKALALLLNCPWWNGRNRGSSHPKGNKPSVTHLTFH